ncbi:MAG: LD-carboxypeptidase [Proteobacteria bacterium]|nr:LD-carboxypeptidase [Pseudomonadota bacterium]
MNHLIPLKKGCKIGLAASSSPFNRAKFDKAIKLLKDCGYKPVYTKTIFNKQGFLAGTPEERAKDLLHLINDDEIPAIFFVRGGYGSIQLLPFIDKKDLGKKLENKIFMGYSDTTALYCYLYSKYNIPLFYGPNIISRYFNPKILEQLSKPRDLRIKVNILRRVGKVLQTKEPITAPIFGGCLSLLSGLVGTPYLKSLKGHILFLEDTGEAPYKLDRLLTQLLMSGVTKGIKAIAVGSMEKCDTPPYTWKDAVLRIAEEMNVPVISNIRAGHGGFDYPLPIGVKAKIDFASRELLIYSPFKHKKQ